MSIAFSDYDLWKTTEPEDRCYHIPCDHGHCELCEGAHCCDACDEIDEQLRLDEECEEAINRFELEEDRFK